MGSSYIPSMASLGGGMVELVITVMYFQQRESLAGNRLAYVISVWMWDYKTAHASALLTCQHKGNESGD